MIPTPHIIYALVDPRTNEIRYVGYTSDQVERLMEHQRPSALKGNTYKNKWIKSLLKEGVIPQLIVISYHESANLLPQAEIAAIKYHREIGCKLTNGTDGGDGGATMTGKTMSIEARAKISKFNQGHVVSIETRKKLSIAKLGVKNSPEANAKISKAHKGLHKSTEKHKAATAESNRNRVWSEESRKKVSESLKIFNKNKKLEKL